MLKFTYENDDQEVKTWIEPVSGALCIQMKDEAIEIPHSIGVEMLVRLKQKQAAFQEEARKKDKKFKMPNINFF